MNPRAIRLLLVLSAFLAGLVLCFTVVLLVDPEGLSGIVDMGSFRRAIKERRKTTRGVQNDLKPELFLKPPQAQRVCERLLTRAGTPFGNRRDSARVEIFEDAFPLGVICEGDIC